MEKEIAAFFNQYRIIDNWAFVVIAAIIIALLIRHLLIGPTLRSLKRFNKDMYKAATKNYLRKSALGWLFFAAGIAIAVLAWLGRLPFKGCLCDLCWIFVSIIALLAGTYLHLCFYVNGILNALKQEGNSEVTVSAD